MNEILTVHPRQYRDAQAIAESFREGDPGHHQPLADERGRRASPHRLRQRPLAGPLRQDRARHPQGVPALARRTSSSPASTAARTPRSTPPSSRRPDRRLRRPDTHPSSAPSPGQGSRCAFAHTGERARRLDHRDRPLLRAADLLLRAVGAVRARPGPHVQPRSGGRADSVWCSPSRPTWSPTRRSGSSAASSRRVSMGPIAIDFGWSLTMLVVIIGLYVTAGIPLSVAPRSIRARSPRCSRGRADAPRVRRRARPTAHFASVGCTHFRVRNFKI